MIYIVHKYILFNFLRFFGYTMLGALVLFSVMDVLEHSDNFIDNNATFSMIARYYLFKAAWIIDMVLPIAMLMATLFTIGNMARYQELTAMFAAGLSLIKISIPLIVFGLMITGFSLAWREYVLPKANVNRTRVWEVEIHQNPDKIRPTQHISITDSEGRLYRARKFDPNANIINGLAIMTAKDSRIVERVDAERAEWDGQYWTLINGTKRVFTDESEHTEAFERLTAKDIEVDPRSFYQDRIRQENMNIRQLSSHVKMIKLSGGDPNSGLVDIQYYLAFPFVNLIVVLMGIILASGPRKTNVASGFGLTLLITFSYHIFMSVGQSLGHNGNLTPVVAAWMGNVFFLLSFLVLFIRARR